MSDNKPVLTIKASVENLGQVKELLPQIATLQQKYEIQLTIYLLSSTDQSIPELP